MEKEVSTKSLGAEDDSGDDSDSGEEGGEIIKSQVK